MTTTKQTHTPTPWIVDENCACWIRQPNGSKRRRIKCPPDSDGFNDARLIASAPLLLEALENAIGIMEDMVLNEDSNANVLNRWPEIRNAIKQARGES